MKRFVIFRHGRYNDSDRMLTIQSAEEIYGRARMLAEQFGQADMVLYSPALRAYQSAQAIALATGAEVLKEESLLGENCREQENCKAALIAEAEVHSCNLVIAVSHYPNISRMFGIGLEPGFEIIFESENWESIFDGQPTNLLTQIKVHNAETLNRYYAPECSAEEKQALQEILLC